MKKALIALACAFIATTGIQAQNEVQYVEDQTQGYIINPMHDNWFISGEGGMGALLVPNQEHRSFGDRLSPRASLYVGKWFTPVIGARLGVNWSNIQSDSQWEYAVGATGEPAKDGWYKLSYVHLGPSLEMMVNLTNWWCGYNPKRVYNLTFFGGAGGVFTLAQDKGQGSWKNAHDAVILLRGGLINTFRVSKHIDINLSIVADAWDNHSDFNGDNRSDVGVSALLGLTYRFNKTDFSRPVVPVCPPVENCDPYREALAAAGARIADLEAQLQACLANLNRPAEVITVVEEETAPLATIYFPIGVSKLTSEDIAVVNAIAEIIKSNPDTKYVVTGWADNYTGTDAINVRLRNERAASVEAQLIAAGVNRSQVSTTINNGSLSDLGEKFVSLDRAATITIAE